VRTLAITFAILLQYGSLLAQPSPLAPMFQDAAQTWGVPMALTQAIARVESGLSPWALNIAGRGFTFDSKEKALEKAQEAQRANQSFDSGVMQVNNFWLRKYGIPLEAAFDPAANIHLGSWILKQEIERHGQNWTAIGAYHSPNDARSRHYVEMVKAALAKGPVKDSPRPVRAGLLPAKPVQVMPSRALSPLVVARRGDQIKQTFDTPFVQRLNRSTYASTDR